VYYRTIVPSKVLELRHDHKSADHECVVNPAEFKAFNGEVARRIGVKPDRVGMSRISVGLDMVTNYSKIVKDVCASHIKANVLLNRDAKNVTNLIGFGSVVVRELKVELVRSYLDCATLTDMLGGRKDVVDRAKASCY
jgi:hypothetical protein